MSFSYKTLNSTDITLTSYIANKQWGVNNSTFSQNGVTIYVGENLPIDKNNPFNPIDDGQTSNNEYRRLVFQSVKNLYYKNYTSGSLTGEFYNSSSYINYEQSTLVSGTIRNLTTITGSNLNPNDPATYDEPTSRSLFDAAQVLYDLDTLDPDAGSRVVVISIDQNVYGSGLSPNSINISGSNYNIQDDGEGNLLDTLATSSLYVGNVLYSQGLIIITNQNYLCILGIPPTAVNDYFSYVNTSPPAFLDILGNDFTDCGYTDYTSFISTGGNFPNFTQNNGLITITPDQTRVIPGNYQLGYTIASTTGIRSNTGSINLTITTQSLQIYNTSPTYTCYGTSSLTPITFSINYGVPYYSYSFDGTNYTGSNSLTSIVVSGSVLSSTSSTVYVKDYTGKIISSSFNAWRPQPTAFTYLSSSAILCGPTGTTTIIIDGGYTAVSASVNGGAYKKLPANFNNATTSSTILYRDVYGCVASSIFNINPVPPITASFSASIISCYEGNNGIATFNFTNNVQNQIYEYYSSDYGQLPEFSGFLPAPINNTSSISFGGLNANATYTMQVRPTTVNTCSIQNYINQFTVTQRPLLTLSTTASYQSTCSNAISYSISGGTPPYTFRAIDNNTGLTLQTDNSPVFLNDLSGSTYSFIVTDTNGCSRTGSNLTVFGRTYIYSGSICLQV